MGEVNPLFGQKGGGIQFDLKQQFIGEFKEIGTIKDWSSLE
ncbi:TNT domain-containing protein [Listeria fleischmannii]|nr:TNT domain-containing protein [Listeria fleischmannii]